MVSGHRHKRHASDRQGNKRPVLTSSVKLSRRQGRPSKLCLSAPHGTFGTRRLQFEQCTGLTWPRPQRFLPPLRRLKVMADCGTLG